MRPPTQATQDMASYKKIQAMMAPNKGSLPMSNETVLGELLGAILFVHKAKL
jgi:hypothetical protein